MQTVHPYNSPAILFPYSVHFYTSGALQQCCFPLGILLCGPFHHHQYPYAPLTFTNTSVHV